jgi:hypothetical protein
MNFNSKSIEWVKKNWALFLAIVIGILAAFLAIQYAMQPLLEQHGFRQTQTALTSYWMIEEGWKLAYETPVGGYPWTIPFEFPIYQALVAFASSVFNTPLDATGRIVSFVFLLGCAWPIRLITKRLGLKKEVAWIICVLLWSSPLYLFWGRTFMIETTAVFFTLVAIAYALDMLHKEPPLKSVILFIAFASVGMLQKVTTVAPALLVMSFVILIVHLKENGLMFPSMRKILLVGISFLIPFALAFLWTGFTDAIKSQSEFGTSLTSSALSNWNFGSLEQRFDFRVLGRIFWKRIIASNAGGILGLALLIYGFISAEKRTRRILLVSLVLFVLPVFIFTNLHYVHTYYQLSSALFLIGMVSIALAQIDLKYPRKKYLAPIVLLLLISHNIYSYHTNFATFTLQKFDLSNSRSLVISDIIKRYTNKNSGIVIFGAGWNSEIAYYSKRKTFTVPNWFKQYDSVWKAPANFIGDLDLGAVVFIQEKSDLSTIKERVDVQRDSCLFKIYENSYIWLPGVKEITMPDGIKLKADEFKNAYDQK